jgi:hypothetical protein
MKSSHIFVMTRRSSRVLCFLARPANRPACKYYNMSGTHFAIAIITFVRSIIEAQNIKVTQAFLPRNQSNHFAICSVESDGLPRQARDSSSSSSRKSRTKRERGRCFSSSRAQAMDPTGELTQILVRPRSFALSFRFPLKAIICQDRLGTNIRNAQAMQYMPCVLSGDCLDRSDHSRLSAGPDGRREDVCCTTRRHSRGPVGGLGGVCRFVQKPKPRSALFLLFLWAIDRLTRQARYKNG